MHVGGAIIPRLTFSAADYLASIERHRANDMLAVPTMAVALLEHPDRLTRDLSSLDAILCGAAPTPTWVWERAATELGITEITTGYGMTECGGSMVLTLPEDPLERHTTTVGRTKMAGAAGLHAHDDELCEYAVADVTTGELQPVGSEGELVSRGPTHMRGFWDKPAETAEALRDGWLHSGDLGVIGTDGYLRLTGRSKELYKSGGELVMPKEIEELVTLLPGVSQAFAIGIPDERWGEAGCVWIVPESGAEVDAAAVLALCREKLARFKVPKHVVFSGPDELPTTATGKVQKFRLVQMAAERLRSS
jgi:fatty-acyl-CoA synthase